MKKNYSLSLFHSFLTAAILLSCVNAIPAECGPTEETSGQGAREIARNYRVNGDGTITDTQTNLMWTTKDSFADLGKCLDWKGAETYVKKLNTGKYKDWRIPTVEELKTLFHEPLSNKSAGGHMVVHIDSKFSMGSALAMWSSDKIHACCPRVVYFTNGSDANLTSDYCGLSGIRAVRSPR